MKITVLLFALSLALAACSGTPRPGDTCGNTSDCPPGQYCARIGVCTQSCMNQEQCPMETKCATVESRAVCLRTCTEAKMCNEDETCTPEGTCMLAHPLDPPARAK